jgi:hypothetical protein
MSQNGNILETLLRNAQLMILTEAKLAAKSGWYSRILRRNMNHYLYGHH